MRLAGLCLLFFAFIFYLGFGISSTIVAPEYARVFALPNDNLYVAPQCLSLEETERYKPLTVGDARKLKLQPEPRCRDERGGFVQEGRSLTGNLMEQLGFLGQIPSRWNSDGTWNW
jgi:hypothetical protein